MTQTSTAPRPTREDKWKIFLDAYRTKCEGCGDIFRISHGALEAAIDNWPEGVADAIVDLELKTSADWAAFSAQYCLGCVAEDAPGEKDGIEQDPRDPARIRHATYMAAQAAKTAAADATPRCRDHDVSDTDEHRMHEHGTPSRVTAGRDVDDDDDG